MAASHEDEVNSIVRDLVWIRRKPAASFEYKPSDNVDNGLIGLYVSVVDKACFVVQSVFVHRKYVRLMARLDATIESQTLDLRYPASVYSHPLHLRDGQISGEINGAESLGAWKCLLIRPNWWFADRLKAIFYRATGQDLAKLYRICSDVSATGVIFSSQLRRDNVSRDIQGRREAFRNLIMSDPDAQNPLGEFISRELKGLLKDAISLANEISNSIPHISDVQRNSSIEDSVLEVINQTVRRKWALIEAAQIITRTDRPPTKSEEDINEEIAARTKSLLDTDNVDH